VDWWSDSVVWWYGGTPRQWELEGRDPWEICARNWVVELRETERGLEVVPPNQQLRIRYEHFVAEPRSTLDEIAGFAGLKRDPRWPAELQRLSFPDRNEAWRAALPPHVVDRISLLQREDLVRMGYLGRP
jgi:hypothetical protein